MNPADTSPSFFIGHIRNGVVVLNPEASLSEGQTVRVVPLTKTEGPLDKDRTDRVQQLRSLFEQWTAEDAQLLPADADRLHAALDESWGLTFRLADIR